MRDHRLKNVVAPFLLLLVGLFMFAPVLSIQAKEPLTVRVGIYDNKPKLWTDENGVARGLFPDILNAIAGSEGWDIEYVRGTWDEGLARLEANEIDIMPDVALSEDRRQKYDFNQETVLVSWGIFYTRLGVDLESIMDLEGKRIAALKTGILYNGPLGLKNLLDSFGIQAEIIDMKVYGDVFDLLDKGEADVGVVNQAFGAANEKDYAVRRTNVIFSPTELRFAFTKGAEKNAVLISGIDMRLRQLKADNNSAYHLSLQRHFGGIIEEIEVFPLWFKYLVSGALVLFMLVLVYILILRGVGRRLEMLVEARTADLKREKESFKSLFEGANDSLVLLDVSDRSIIECNDAAWKRLGLSSKDQLIGKTPLDVSTPQQPDGRSSTEVLEDVLAKVAEKGEAYVEWTCRHSNGATMFMEVSLTPLAWGGKGVVLAALRNVTEQKLAEEKVLALDRLKGRFITVLSHVTRTPLNRIRWSLESLDSGDFGKPTKEGRALIKQALGSGVEIMQVIDNMNTTLDIERGALTLEQAPTSLESIVNSVAKYFKGLPECKDAVCKIDVVGKRTPAVRADADKIYRVIYGFMDNARRFMSGDAVEIAVTIERKDGTVRCSIADKGIGIPAAEQKHIFERFFRASNAMLKYQNGMGVGLYIAKSIIEKHGGAIGFSSEEGVGSTFWFELPIAD